MQKRTTGIPIGNAGEYFVMGELLRRGFDTQLADRNTKAYDILVVDKADKNCQKIEVKTARTHSWFARLEDYKKPERLGQVTVFVHLSKNNKKPARFFIVKNHDVRKMKIVRKASKWQKHGSVRLNDLRPYENRWENLLK